MARMIAYIRVSTGEQAKTGISLDEQEARLRAWCTAHGHELAGVTSDGGVSGSVAPDKRPGLGLALRELEAGGADGLVAVRLDRLSRCTRDFLELSDRFDDNGWTLATVEENLDTSTPAGELVLTILAAVAQMERRVTIDRIRNNMKHLAKEGKPRSGKAPYGYTNCNGQLVADPKEQEILQEMLHMQRCGISLRHIAGRLGDNPRTGKPWTHGNVYSILNTHYGLEAAKNE